MTQKRIPERTYTTDSPLDRMATASRRTICHCDRPSPVREVVGEFDLGVKAEEVIRCLKCGREVKE